MEESNELKQTIDDLNRIIDEYKKEIKTLREAFEFLLSDWVEELEKRGVSQEYILAQRKTFDKIMYWKHGEKFNE